MNGMENSNDFQERAAQIEKLVQRVHALEDAKARGMAIELLQAVMDLHRSVLSRMLELASDAGAQEIFARFAADPLISGLLVLYDLHPDSIEVRVQAAVEKVRPYVESHAGRIELLSVDDGVATVRLQASTQGCGSADKLKAAVEQAIVEAAPDIAGVQVEGISSPQHSSSFVPLTALQGSTAG